MATTERITGGINNIDLGYAQTLINNLRNRINTTRVVAAQDVQDLIWLYNSLVNHTHSYYDYEFSKYGNINQAVFVPYETPTEVYVFGSSYVTVWPSGFTLWIYNGTFIGSGAGLTSYGSYRLGTYRETVKGYNYYSIIPAGYYKYYSSSVGSTKSTYGINGGALFQYTAELASGKITAATMLNALSALVNNIRSHTHLFDDASV